MYAGVPGQGATDAWYQALLDVEDLKWSEIAFSGGAADIHTFSDQIPRELLYALAEEAGMPKQILKAYRNFLETPTYTVV